MIINISAGHNMDGKKGCGAIGHIKESTEARKVKDLVIKYLKSAKCTVYDCTINDGKNASDTLKRIVIEHNEHKADLDVSIHFNAGGGTGTEVLVHSDTSKSVEYAKRICAKISKVGYKDRGVKERPDLYFLRKTKAPALLIEVCFVDNKKDTDLYINNYKKIARSIAEAIVNKTINISTNKEFKVKVKVDSLNIRSGAGTDFRIVGKIEDNGTYTIVETSGNWGLLKSKAGWINISEKYVTRM